MSDTNQTPEQPVTIPATTPVIKTLNANEKQEVTYCIPNWLRDEQIRMNNANVKGRIEPGYELRTDPIACVNFGPSLNDTWEKVRDFKYTITCSGAYKFLVDRGIVPTWHLDVDPRPHKILLIGKPDPRTEFLIASTCHPDLFKFLEDAGCSVKLWHILDTTDDGLRVLPPGEWALTGSCSAGGRTVTMARFLGFKDLHIFGMDGNESDKYGKHADKHPNQPKKYSITTYNGVDYKTTPSMLEAARGIFHELDVMHDVSVTFYGEGLCQAMAKDYVRKPIPGDSFIGLAKPELISNDYMKLNATLHTNNLAYGVGGGKHATTVKSLLKVVKKETEYPTVLDYGCGKGYLQKELGFPIYEYDPAIPGKTEPPLAADIVVCTDVLEHIEPDKIEVVIGDLARCTKQVIYMTINTGPAQKTLPDGRNTHLIQQPLEWWKERLEVKFNIGTMKTVGPEIYVVASPKFKKSKTKLNAHRVEDAPQEKPQCATAD